MDGSTLWGKDVEENPSKYAGYLIDEFKVTDKGTQEGVYKLVNETAERYKLFKK